MKQISALIILLIALSCLATIGYRSGLIQLNYPSGIDYPVRGIDISHHQGAIDWAALCKEDIKFVYIKATEGGDFRDDEFLSNWANAKSCNLYVGAYHFFTFCRPGSEQAKNFLGTVPQDAASLPPVIDFEYGGNCKARPKKEEALKEIRDFIALLEQQALKRPVFYVTYEAYNEYLKGEINDHPIWIRDILFHPELVDKRPWTIWQYADNGRINGIKGPVDLNVFNGGSSEFMEFVQGRK